MDKILLGAGPLTLLLGLLGNMAIAQTSSPVTLIHNWDAGREPPVVEAARFFPPLPLSGIADVAHDTVSVSREITFFINFPENVTEVYMDYGSYTGQLEHGNVLYLIPHQADMTPSALLVKTRGGGSYWYYINYKQRLEKFFLYYCREGAE